MVLTFLFGIGFVILYSQLGSSDPARALCIGVGLFLFAERVESVLVADVRMRREAERHRESEARLSLNERNHRELLDTILRTATKERGIVNLGDLTSAFHTISELLSTARAIDDITFRTDDVSVSRYKEAVDSYAEAVWKNIDRIYSYRLVICNQSIRYPEIMLGTRPQFPPRFEVRNTFTDLGPEYPYPNFLILKQCDLGAGPTDVLVLGWPYNSDYEGKIFLIEDAGLVRYFGDVFQAILNHAKLDTEWPRKLTEAVPPS